ncbi:small nucleolar ribonucleoprotein [Ephemerocybe angulata]|uniref:U3 small nucleolar ribonucleoprotein protein MPP10 n=1 Tax=Ephemerocybe angulata TaxID=980116 RepID=A0A8H6IKA5_9AGAR|nr:small nucleolar ribonucleoprotein [Tulosesus angulatus]
MASESAISTIPELSTLSKAVETPEQLASGSQEIQNAALGAAKFIFDLSLKSEEDSLKHVNDLISSITPSAAPQTRSQSRNATRETVPPPPKSLFKPTPLTTLFTENLDEDQIWAQLDIRTKQVCEVLDVVLEGELPGEEAEEEDEFEKAMREEAAGMEFDDEEGFSEDSEEDDEEDDEEEGEDDDEEMYEGFEYEDGEEGLMDLNGSDDEEEVDGQPAEESASSSEEELPSRPRKRKKGVTSELDDGFFNLSSFKAEIEKAEARSSSRGHLAEEDDSDEEELGDIDLFAPVEGDDVEEDDESKELFYADFFEAPRNAPKPAAPASKKSKAAPKADKTGSRGVRFNDEVRVKKIKRSGKGRSLNDDEEEEEDEDDDYEDVFGEAMGEEDESGSEFGEEDEDDEEGSDANDSEDDSEEEDEGRETMERLKDDLLADDDDEDDEQKDMTTHEKRMAALKAQISELETENVSKKHWTLMGEADTRTRPQNSLLEEDLEFERTMKPTPVITEEAVQSLEELIKARILENNFDDVVRIRAMEDKPFLPSRLLELKDTQSQQSLAQIYESDYMAAQDGGALPDDRDGKLKKEHDEIEEQWDKICSKLDALSNAHFVPKQPKSLISTVSNVSTATMESALPTTKSAASMLAPEEVFAAGSSQPRARTEMTPSEKKALRLKERKAKRKQRDLLDKTVDKVAKMRGVGSVKKQKQAALDSIVKHGKGVTVVGKAAKDLKSRGKMPKKS